MQYFNLNNLIYDVSLLKHNIEKIDNWEYYGKGRARLGVCLSDRGTILHIASKFKNAKEIIYKIESNCIHPYERVLPHTDHDRRVTCNIPVSGDFKNSYVKFYDESATSTSIESTPSTTKVNTAKIYDNASVIDKVSYTTPICFDTQNIHGVDNLTKQMRYIITISFNLNLSYDDIFDMYNKGELLI